MEVAGFVATAVVVNQANTGALGFVGVGASGMLEPDGLGGALGDANREVAMSNSEGSEVDLANLEGVGGHVS